MPPPVRLNEKSEVRMGIKNKVQILLFPVTLAAGIITGIAIERTKKKAAGIAAVNAALREELPAEEAFPEDTAKEAAEAEKPAEQESVSPEL